MKAILISVHAKWCALMMNGKKNIEIRKENVGKAVQKLIDEYGYADIYVYCSKELNIKDALYLKKISAKVYRTVGSCYTDNEYFRYAYFGAIDEETDICEEKVRDFIKECCGTNLIGGSVSQNVNYEEDDIKLNGKVAFKFRCYKVEKVDKYQSLNPLYTIPACLTGKEWCDYLGEKTGCAIHISDLEIFDRPKELSEFKKNNATGNCWKCPLFGSGCSTCKLTKAPQSFCYVEVDNE